MDLNIISYGTKRKSKTWYQGARGITFSSRKEPEGLPGHRVSYPTFLGRVLQPYWEHARKQNSPSLRRIWPTVLCTHIRSSRNSHDRCQTWRDQPICSTSGIRRKSARRHTGSGTTECAGNKGLAAMEHPTTARHKTNRSTKTRDGSRLRGYTTCIQGTSSTCEVHDALVNSLPKGTELPLHTTYSCQAEELGRLTRHLHQKVLRLCEFHYCSILRGTLGTQFPALTVDDPAYVVMWKKNDQAKQLLIVSVASLRVNDEFDVTKWSYGLVWNEFRHSKDKDSTDVDLGDPNNTNATADSAAFAAFSTSAHGCCLTTRSSTTTGID